ncbi:MAG TPA: PASTA domain-containing protein [Mycobacteriales bacterium]|nr:PASTA domain-containing protein [Mycobacteriales bacterium]
MSHALRTRLGRIGLVAALLAGVLAVSFGTGYRASRAALDDGSAALTKGHTVVRVNGESGRVEAKLTAAVAESRQPTRVVELPDGQLYVENVATGERWKVDTTTMTPQALPAAGSKDAAGSLVGGGSEMYSVDRATGQIGWVHPRTRAVTPVATLGRVQGMEVDSSGTAWVLVGGTLQEIVKARKGTAVEVGKAGEPALLTLVGDRPTVLRLAAGEAVRYGRTAGDVQRAWVPELAGQPADTVRIAAPGPGDILWVARAGDRRLLRVDLPTAQVRSVEFTAGGKGDVRNGPPVVSGDRVLVPDYTARIVHVLDAASGQERRQVGPVPGSSREFDVITRGSKVFINDQYASRGVVVDRDGTDRTIDKGTGDGLDGDRRSAPRGPARPATDPGPAGPADPGPGRPGGTAPTSRPPAPPPVAVPDVVGQDRQAACAILRAAKLDCVQVPVGNDGAGPTGQVLRTAPTADTQAPAGQIVTVSYRGDIQLPDVTGLPSATACSAVEAAGLVCERVELPAVADPAAVDKVSAQDPAAGSPAQTGDRVRVSYPTQVLVPDVSGLLVADACARLAAFGLACTQVDAGTRPAAEPPNVVLDQAPPAAAAATPGTAVSVRFYSSVVVPTVTGLDPAAARAAITAQGLTPVPVPDLVTNQPNVVLDQAPPKGSPAAPGTQVQYVYEDVGPAQVRLAKKGGEFRYALQPEAGYVDQRLLGWGFPAQAGGTTAVYRYVCDGARCGGAGTFYYSMTNVPSYDPGWTNNGVAFYAYPTQVDPRLLPIKAMFDGAAWVWAAEGTPDYQTYLGRGYTRPEGFTLGWVWPP